MIGPEASERSNIFDDLSSYESLTVKVRTLLERAIILHELEPGTRLKENDVARQMGISRGPVREAFRLLEAEGLLQGRLRRGFIVPPLRLQEIEQICEIRPWLEGNAVRLALAHRSARFISGLERIVGEMDQAIERGDSAAYTLLDAEFHRTIYEASQNRILIDLLNTIWKKALRYLHLANSHHDRQSDLPAAHRRHKRLLEALKNDDPRAGEIAERNITESRAMFLARLKEIGIR